MAKPKKIKEEEIEFPEAIIEASNIELPKEIDELKVIHTLMVSRGIKDIGQLEVMISRLQ